MEGDDDGPVVNNQGLKKNNMQFHSYCYERSEQRSHNLRKFPQIYAVFMGVVLVIMRILCILFKSLLSHSQPPSPYRNKDIEISCESAGSEIHCSLVFGFHDQTLEFIFERVQEK